MNKHLLGREWDFFSGDDETLVDLPTNKDELLRDLDSILREIETVLKLVSESGEKSVPPFNRPKSYLKRLVYQLGRHFYEPENEELLNVFRDSLRNKIVMHGGRTLPAKNDFGSDNLFYMCFRVIDPDRKTVGSGEISRLAKQLLFASESEVPPEYLIGFIYQNGGQKVDLRKRKKEKKRIRKMKSQSSASIIKLQNNDSDDDW